MHMAAKTSRRPTQCKGRRFAKVLSALLLVAFLAISGCAARQLYQDYLVRHTQAQLTQLHRAVSTETVEEQVNSDWSRGMLELNPDYVGWLTVYGTEVDGPVVQGEDNDEYLRTDFYGDYSIGGVFFMDCLVDLEQDGNLMIYSYYEAGFFDVEGNLLGFPEEVPEDELAQEQPDTDIQEILDSTEIEGGDGEMAGFPARDASLRTRKPMSPRAMRPLRIARRWNPPPKTTNRGGNALLRGPENSGPYIYKGGIQHGQTLCRSEHCREHCRTWPGRVCAGCVTHQGRPVQTQIF